MEHQNHNDTLEATPLRHGSRMPFVESPQELRSLSSPAHSNHSVNVRLAENLDGSVVPDTTNHGQIESQGPPRCLHCDHLPFHPILPAHHFLLTQMDPDPSPIYAFFPESPSPAQPSAACVLPSPIHRSFPSPYGGIISPVPSPSTKRPRYEIPPGQPFLRPIRRLLEFTDFPFMILWTFASYWTVILCFSAHDTTSQTWLSACFAGVAVGVALNANAYKYIVKPKTRSRNAPYSLDRSPTICISPSLDRTPPEVSGDDLTKRNQILKLVNRFPRFFSQLVDTKRPCVRRSPLNLDMLENPMTPGAPCHNVRLGQQRAQSRAGPIHALSSGMNSLTKLARDWSNIADTLEWELDIPTILRFFFIPFAVSSISGMTSDEDKYVLVFPKNMYHLTVAILVPAAFVGFLLTCRLLMLMKLKVVWRWKVVFFNGCLIH